MKNNNSLSEITKELLVFKNTEKAVLFAGFFKTGPGQYGEGDVFLGITVPEQRKIAKKYTDLSLEDLQNLLNSEFHEFRLVALFILVDKYKKSSEKDRKAIIDFYLENTKKVNNWDLVDSSAGYILGDYLYHKCHPELVSGSNKKIPDQVRNYKDERQILYQLARSDNIWERRISIIATQGFISKGKFEDTLKIAEILLADKQDLIHKAVGWMLREVGNRDLKTEENFLDKHYKVMPRTMLRYAIEKFEKEKKAFYMRKDK